MGVIHGERAVEVAAPVETCYAVAADIEGAVAWQPSLREVQVLERDGEERARLVETVSDAKVKTVKTRLRFSYDPPARVHWEQVKGDVKSLVGEWDLVALDGGRTRATYRLTVDPGRVLGLLLRGPAEGKVRDFLLGGAAEGLKQRVEARG